MQLMNESVTAMPLPIPMSRGVLIQGTKFSGLVVAITALGNAGVLGFRPPNSFRSVPSLLHRTQHSRAIVAQPSHVDLPMN